MWKAIAAVDKYMGIGLKGKMPWGQTIKRDLQFFKHMTAGCPVIVGSTTAEQLPPLPGREIVVLRRHTDIEQLKFEYPDAWVIGGAKTYERLRPHCEELYLTHIDKEFLRDTDFPPFDHLFVPCDEVGDFYDGPGHSLHCRIVRYSKIGACPRVRA